jgi:hypothetical protein
MGEGHRERGGESGSRSSVVEYLAPRRHRTISTGLGRAIRGATYLESNTVEDIARICSFARLECVHDLEEVQRRSAVVPSQSYTLV